MAILMINGQTQGDWAAIQAETTQIHVETSAIHVETTAILPLAKSISSVVGATADIYTANTLYGKSVQRNPYIQQRIHPTLANAIVVTGTSTSWELGTETNMMTSGFTSAWTIIGLNIEDVSTVIGSSARPYELVLYEGVTGAASTELGRIRGYRNPDHEHGMMPFSCKIISAGQKTKARVTQASSNAVQVSFSLFYKYF